MNLKSILHKPLAALALATAASSVQAQADFPFASSMARFDVTLDKAGAGSYRLKQYPPVTAAAISVTLFGASEVGGGGTIMKASERTKFENGQALDSTSLYDYDPRNGNTTHLVASLSRGEVAVLAYDNGSSSLSNKAKIGFVEDRWSVVGKNAAGKTVVWDRLPNSVMRRLTVGQFDPLILPLRIAPSNRYVVRRAAHSRDAARTFSLIKAADLPKWASGQNVAAVKTWGLGIKEEVLPVAPALATGLPAGDYFVVARSAVQGLHVVFELVEYAPRQTAWTTQPNDFPYSPLNWTNVGSLTSSGRGEALVLTPPSLPAATGQKATIMTVSRSWNQSAIFDPSETTNWQSKLRLNVATAGKVYALAGVDGDQYSTVHLLTGMVPKGKTYAAGLRNVRSQVNPYGFGLFLDQPTVPYKVNGVLRKTWTKTPNSITGEIDNPVLTRHTRFFRVHPQSRLAIRYVGGNWTSPSNAVYIIPEDEIVRYRTGQSVDVALTLNTTGTEQILSQTDLPPGGYYLVAPTSGQRGAYEIIEYR